MCTLCTLSKNCTFWALCKMLITCALRVKVHKVQKVHDKNSHGMSGIKKWKNICKCQKFFVTLHAERVQMQK